MTCIVAIQDGRTIIMGADSAASSDNRISTQSVPKIFKIVIKGPRGPTEMLVGFAGCFRAAQLIKHVLTVPEWTSGSPEDYLVRLFLPEVMKLLQAGGIGTKDDPLGLLLLLVGLQGRLFEVESNGQLLESTLGYASIGTGSDCALASMAALLENTDDAPWTVLDKALEIAAKFCIGVRGPFHTDYLMAN